MFPNKELSILARRKKTIRLRIARERFECVTLVQATVHPFRWVDRIHSYWQAIPKVVKLAAMPLGFFLKMKFFSKKQQARGLAKWIPLAWKIARSLSWA